MLVFLTKLLNNLPYIKKIEFFIQKIINHNQHTNLISKSTIENIWDRHVLDCLQLSEYINEKKSKILDLGTGAGLPGVVLSILGYDNVLMIESVKKKTNFVKNIILDLSLTAKIQNKRKSIWEFLHQKIRKKIIESVR